MIAQLVGRARRRLLLNEVVAQSTCAIAVALGAFILLLLAGTQILDWRWLVLLPAASLAFGLYQTLRKLPSPYGAAQLIDRRQNLADSLSTALFFTTPEATVRDPGWMRQPQFEQAEQVARTVDLRQAVPFTMPRAVYAAGLLAFVATSLFALRYGLNRRLDLRPPLARILQQSLGWGDDAQQVASRDKKREAPAKRSQLQDALGMSLEDADGKMPGNLDAAPDSALDTVGVPDVDNSKKGSPDSASKGKTPGTEAVQGEEAESEATDDAQSANAGQNAAEGQQGAGQSKQGQQQAGSQSPGTAGDKSSLMSKLRDAMQNLLSRMKPQPTGAGGQQQASTSQNGREGRQQQSNSQKGRSGQGKQQQGGQESDSQDGQQGEDAQNAQNAQGRGAGQSSEEQASKQPGSGIGRQDGNKDVKLAEQLAAMGKISEIIGKRSANVTGDVTVEVQSGNQQLRTAYTQNSAQHADSGGEINRDEVPVVFQPYVQQYFEQVRRQEVPGVTAPPVSRKDAKAQRTQKDQ
jgi:hypothetical protein